MRAIDYVRETHRATNIILELITKLVNFLQSAANYTNGLNKFAYQKVNDRIAVC